MSVCGKILLLCKMRTNLHICIVKTKAKLGETSGLKLVASSDQVVVCKSSILGEMLGSKYSMKTNIRSENVLEKNVYKY